MKILDNIKNKFKKKKQPKQSVETKTSKELATKKGEPWVQVIDTQINPESPSEGYFELDWNESFITMLTSNGYSGVTDDETVNKWFDDLCKGIVLETMDPDVFNELKSQQKEADEITKKTKTALKDGKVEYS